MLQLHRWGRLYVEVVVLLLLLGPWWPRQVDARQEVLPFVGRDPVLRPWPCFVSLALVALLVRAVRLERCRRVRQRTALLVGSLMLLAWVVPLVAVLAVAVELVFVAA